MAASTERRREKRLRYNWPIWFAEDYNNILSQGQMVDISSGGAAFTCYADKCPHTGEHLTARFSIPRYGKNDSFDLENFIRHGKICRIDNLSPYVRKVAVQFAEALPFQPGQVTDSDALTVGSGSDVSDMGQSGDADQIAQLEARAMAGIRKSEGVEQTDTI